MVARSLDSPIPAGFFPQLFLTIIVMGLGVFQEKHSGSPYVCILNADEAQPNNGKILTQRNKTRRGTRFIKDLPPEYSLGPGGGGDLGQESGVCYRM